VHSDLRVLVSLLQVRILYVRNLMLSTTEDTLEQTFTKAAGRDGCIERVKKLKDYAFIHFRERPDALRAMQALNGQHTTSVFYPYSLDGTGCRSLPSKDKKTPPPVSGVSNC